MTHVQYLGIAFGLVWIGLALYLFSIARRQAKLEAEISKLSARSPNGSAGGLD